MSFRTGYFGAMMNQMSKIFARIFLAFMAIHILLGIVSPYLLNKMVFIDTVVFVGTICIGSALGILMVTIAIAEFLICEAFSIKKMVITNWLYNVGKKLNERTMWK